MARIAYPCVLTENGKSYNGCFPDLNSNSFSGKNLYETLKIAYYVLIIEAYLAEKEQNRLKKPTPREQIELTNNQFISYVTCDTEILSNVLELYDTVAIDDLTEFIAAKTAIKDESDVKKEDEKENKEELKQHTETAYQKDTDTTNDTGSGFDFFDEVEVITPSQETDDIKPSYVDSVEVPFNPPESAIDKKPNHQNGKNYRHQTRPTKK